MLTTRAAPVAPWLGFSQVQLQGWGGDCTKGSVNLVHLNFCTFYKYQNFLTLLFFCWSNMLLLDPNDHHNLDLLSCNFSPLPSRKLLTQKNTKITAYKRHQTMRYRRQTVPNNCTKWTLSSLQCVLILVDNFLGTK